MLKTTILLLAVCILIAACNNSATHQSDSTGMAMSTQIGGDVNSKDPLGLFAINPTLKPYLDKFAQTDFTAYVDKEVSAYDAGQLTSPFKAGEDGINPQKLSAKERKLVFGVMNGKATVGLSTVQALRLHFRQAVGRWPNDASELLAWLWANKPDEAERVSKLPTVEQFRALKSMVNPVTGKFYNSFTASHWSPGGLNIKELHTEAEVKAAYGGRPGPDRMHYPSVLGVYLIEVWGETPGKKLGGHPVMAEDPTLFSKNPPPPITGEDLLKVIARKKADPNAPCGCGK